MLLTCKGIVLRAKDYGESHQIVQVFSDQKGKFSFMARGSKKPKSRFSAVTEPFTEAQFICFMGSGLANLSQADILHSHRGLSADLIKSFYGTYWFEMIDRLLTENEPNHSFYRFLSQMLIQLESGKSPEILTRIFELRIMEVAGYQPVFDHCVNCQSHRPSFRFSYRHGGFLCSDCWDLDKQAMPLSDPVIKILPLLQRINVDRIGNIRVNSQTEQQLENAIQAFMNEHIGVEFNARKMIDQLKD